MSDRRPAPAPLWLQDQHDAADARAGRWRVLGFIIAGAVWALPSLFVWLFLVVGLAGWSGEHSETEGLLSGSTEGISALLLGTLLEVASAAALVGTARWALGRTRTAVAVGLVATVWLQTLVSVAVLMLA